MSKVIQRLKHPDRVTIRGVAAEIPLHFCFETQSEIGDDLRNYQENAALEVGDVLFVTDAP